MLVPVIGGGGGIKLIDAITAAGLTANLQLVLDAGDAASYTSGQSWLDQSGNDYDFFRGSTSSSQSTDPVFTGTAGSLSSYFALDGTQFFQYNTTNETWMQNLHKNSATFTLLTWYYYPGSGVLSHCGTRESGVAPGTGIAFGGSAITVYDADANVFGEGADSGDASSTGWHLNAVSIAEASSTGFFYLDGDYDQVGGSDTFTCTYSSPSTGSASNTMRIDQYGPNLTGAVSGSGVRRACFAAWSTALTKANLDAIWARTRGRFGK